MSHLLPLMQREWLQHRLGWSLMAGLPIGIALLLVAFGEVQLEPGELAAAGDVLPALLTTAAIVLSAAVVFVVAWLSSLILVSGLSRRDHADRSVEFWLSLPVGHGRFLATPLLVHLVLVPAAALLVGLAGGALISLVLQRAGLAVTASTDLERAMRSWAERPADLVVVADYGHTMLDERSIRTICEQAKYLVDKGATLLYTHGEVTDGHTMAGRAEILGKALDAILVPAAPGRIPIFDGRFYRSNLPAVQGASYAFVSVATP